MDESMKALHSRAVRMALADPAFCHAGGGGHTSSAKNALAVPEARFLSKRT